MPALDSLLGSLRGCLDRFPDKRRGMNATYGIGDIGMAAFSVFFMQSPARSWRIGSAGWRRPRPLQLRQLFGIAKIPSDNHIRDMLDPAAPALLRPVFAETIEQLEQIDGGLDMFRRLDGHDADRAGWQRVSLFAEDPLPALLDAGQRQWRDRYFHSMLAATLVAPGL